MSVLTHPGSPTHPAHQSVRQSVGQSARQKARPGSHSASRSVSVIVLQHGSATVSVSMAEPRALRAICLYQLRHPQSSLRHCRSAARRRPRERQSPGPGMYVQAACGRERKHGEWASTTQHSKLPGAPRPRGAESKRRTPDIGLPEENYRQQSKVPPSRSVNLHSSTRPSPTPHQSTNHPRMSAPTHPPSTTWALQGPASPVQPSPQLYSSASASASTAEPRAWDVRTCKQQAGKASTESGSLLPSTQNCRGPQGLGARRASAELQTPG